MFQLSRLTFKALLPCLLCMGLNTASAEQNFSDNKITSLTENHLPNPFRSKCRQRRHKRPVFRVAYGSFYNVTPQVITPSLPGADIKVAFPEESVSPIGIESNNVGTLFTIERSGIYQISYSFSIGEGSIGTGSLALDIDQQDAPVSASLLPVNSGALSKTIQLFLSRGQTIDVNYFSAAPGDSIIINQATITFLRIAEPRLLQ